MIFFGENSLGRRRAKAKVIEGLRWAPETSAATYMARATPIPHTTATCQSPTCAPVRTALATTPVPVNTRMNVPTASATHARSRPFRSSNRGRLDMQLTQQVAYPARDILPDLAHDRERLSCWVVHNPIEV